MYSEDCSTHTALTIHCSGVCENIERVSLSSTGQYKMIQYPCMFGVIRSKGRDGKESVTLFDTGHSPEFFKATSHCPYCLYATVVPVTVREEECADHQLFECYGVKPEMVNYIIISHFHADHIGALKRFPNAKYVCLKSGFDKLRHKTGFSAICHGFIPKLLPDDFDERVMLIDDTQQDGWLYLYNSNLQGYDLFADNSVYLVKLPGHHAGHCGALVHTKEKTYFLVGDACWSSKAYKTNELPSVITKLIVHDDWSSYKETLKMVHDFHLQQPAILIVPSHCQDIYDSYCVSKIKYEKIPSKL